MNDNSLQPVLVVLSIPFSFIIDALPGVGENIENLRKLAVSVQFELLHGLKIELETL